jgi:ABC-2 type transport system permease protein
VLIIAFYKLKMAVTLGVLLYLPLVLLGGALIHGAFFILISVPVFWLTDNSGFGYLIFDFNDFVRYPLSIYSRGIQILLTFLLPYAFINFYPAQYFLKKTDLLGFHPCFVFLTPVVGGILFWGAYRFWLRGISAYKSTGS